MDDHVVSFVVVVETAPYFDRPPLGRGLDHCPATQSPSLCEKSNNIQQKRLSIVNVAESGDIEGVTATQQN